MNLIPGDLGGRVSMDLSNGLWLTSIDYSDAAMYTCKATNSLGDASNNTRLVVIGKKYFGKFSYNICTIYNHFILSQMIARLVYPFVPSLRTSIRHT